MAMWIHSRLVIACLLLPLAGCRAQSKATAAGRAPSTPRPSIQPYIPSFKFKSPDANNLQSEFMGWEKRANEADTQVALYAEAGNPEPDAPTRVERVKNSDSWPDDTLISFIVTSDRSGRPRFIQIVPHSESGDWDESQGFLFDEEGRLRFWSHEFGWFHDGDIVSRFKVSSAWDANGHSLERKQAGPEPAEYPISKVPEALTAHALMLKRRLVNVDKSSKP